MRAMMAIIVGMFVAVGFGVYGYSVLVNQFVEFDDTLLIIDNLSVIQGGRWSSVVWAFKHYDPELYIPLTFLSFQFDAVLGALIAGAPDLNPIIFHLSNLLQHIANALLITWILNLLFKRLDAAILLGLLFLVHPLNVEAVAWASGRKDLLSTLFFLLSIAAYLQYQSHGEKWGIGSVASGTLSMLAKISTAPLPAVLLLLDWLEGRALTLRSLWTKKGYFVAALLLGIVALLGKDGVIARSDPLAVFMLMPTSIVFYIEKLLLPINLSIFYPLPEDVVSIANPDIIVALIAVPIAAIGIWMLRKRYRALAAGSVIALFGLVPSFFQYYRGSELYLAADRYLYMPFLGILIALSPVIIVLLDRFRRTTLGVCAVVFLVCSVLSFNQASVWRNTYTLFSHTLINGESFGAYEKVGAWLLREGKQAEAIAALKRSIELAPNSAAYFRLGVAAMEQGRLQDAKLLTQEAIKLSPENPQAYVNLSKIYWDEGDRELALQYAEKAVEFHSFAEMGLGNLATMYTLTGQKEKALEIIDRIYDVYPNSTRPGPLLKKLGVTQ